MGGPSGSESGSESGRSNRSSKKYKKDKKDKKDKKYDSGDEHEKKDDKHKDDKHKDDKHKGDKHKDDKHKPSSQMPTQIAHALSGTAVGGLAQEFLNPGGGHGHGFFREGPGGTGAPAAQAAPVPAPPAAAPDPGPVPTIPSNPPTGPGTGPSGQRIPCTTTDAFPLQAAGPAHPFVDATGQPAYVGSALISGANVQPCRLSPSGCFIAADGVETQHNGRYDLLPLTDAMEWVPASGGVAPPGKRVVEGGIENGASLYHACARVNGVLLPGKAGPAVGGARIPAGGAAHFFAHGYFVLCWRE